jgi:glycosyltransferase involved in cell wall biosynthesis
MTNMKYVLISPAKNEATFIQKTLDSMIAQTLLPERWVIVDDGSTDRTAEIVGAYTKRYPWIELIRRPKRESHNFAGKVHAFNAALERIQSLEYEVIGNLDADLSFDSDYLEFLMQKFAEDSELGVAGTPFIENGYDSARDSFEGQNHVAGGCQLFRRKCFHDIGGYVANRAGGIDWVAVTTARMKGWKTRSFLEKRFRHYRPLGTAQRNKLKASFSYGEKDYYFGNSPLWQLFRAGYRMAKPPYVIEGAALLSGFCWATLRRANRISPELMRFHRSEQMEKLGVIFTSLLQFKNPDNFRLATSSQLAKSNTDKSQVVATGTPNAIAITQRGVDAPTATPGQGS